MPIGSRLRDERVAGGGWPVNIQPMVSFHPEFVLDENQNRTAVLLPLSDWDRIVSELEELDDIRAYDAALTEGGKRLPFEQAVQEIR